MLAITLVSCNSKNQLAYVRTADLVNAFVGMQDASVSFQKKAKQWEAGLDSIANVYQTKIAAIYTDTVGLTEVDKAKRLKEVDAITYQMYAEIERAKEEAALEDQILTEQVYGKINGYIKEYGELEGYKMILGTTANGSLLYADSAIDITDKLIIFVNKKYEGQ